MAEDDSAPDLTPRRNEVSARLLAIGKQEDDPNAIRSQALRIEDEFSPYYDTSNNPVAVALRPPYDFRQLRQLAQENNALSPCVDAMETNIDGTGYAIELTDTEDDEDPDGEATREAIESFFDNPYPGMSFTAQRRLIRRDLEETGNAAIEVMRNPAGELVFVRPMPFQTVRLIKLDEPVPVSKQVTRGRQTTTYTVMERERRFVQVVQGKATYFKEFGASRDLDRETGKWAESGQRLPFEKRANEVIHLTMHPDVTTPYGVPRWIEQLPSVLGSRKAEEFNLNFFDSGGVPPVLITVAGGTVSESAAQELKRLMSGRARDKMQAAILEIIATGGSIDKDSAVKVEVHKFGSEQQKDSMFEKYDERCEQRIRRAFRLPPIFVGQASDYSFATAFASYKVAEAQVFAPERDEFDEAVNTLLMPELDPSGRYVYRSMPLTIDDIEQQIRAIEMARPAIDNQHMVDALNEITNLNLKVAEGLGEMSAQSPGDASSLDSPDAGPPGGGGDEATPDGGDQPGMPSPVAASDVDLSKLATDIFRAVRREHPDSGVQLVALTKTASKLPAADRETVYRMVAAMRYGDADMHEVAEASVQACGHVH